MSGGQHYEPCVLNGDGECHRWNHAHPKPRCVDGWCGPWRDGVCVDCGNLRNHTPTPVPSEVAETTAGEREGYGPTEYIEEEHDCDGSDEHPLPCWPACTARTSAEPDAGEVEALAKVLDEATAYTHPRRGLVTLNTARAEVVLASDWLAAHDHRVRREEGERIAQAIEAERPEIGLHINVSEYRRGVDDGLTKAARIARAASVGPTD